MFYQVHGVVAGAIRVRFTFHDLSSSDADLARLVPAEREARLRVDDLQLCIPHHAAAGAGLRRQRVLGEGGAHGENWPRFGHPVALPEGRLRDTAVQRTLQLLPQRRRP